MKCVLVRSCLGFWHLHTSATLQSSTSSKLRQKNKQRRILIPATGKHGKVVIQFKKYWPVKTTRVVFVEPCNFRVNISDTFDPNDNFDEPYNCSVKAIYLPFCEDRRRCNLQTWPTNRKIVIYFNLFCLL